MENLYPRGSEWRKWDLHVHPPFCQLNDGYKTSDGSDILDKFCDELEGSDVYAFGITDYFSFDAYNKFINQFKSKFPNSEKRFFFNLELRLNESVNKKNEEVNIHLIFNPLSLDRISKFLSKLKVVRTADSGVQITCNELKTSHDFQSATVTRDFILEAYKNTFGNSPHENNFIVVTASNNDGIRPESGKKRKENISDEIDKFSDAFFGGLQNVDYYLKENRYEDNSKSPKKPVVAGSDSHSFEDLSDYLGKRFINEVEENGNKKEIVEKDVTWIKADLTYEGLKQMLYEPEAGSRVKIGPLKPDFKDDYKIIRKVYFKSSSDFPEEITLNENLCSIIGSRSSGKSSLLAYIAHSIDPNIVEGLIDGPGEGEQFTWGNINLDYSIEWANGKNNTESPGNIVFLPQNYLYKESQNPNSIKEKIKPVLFKINPEFGNEYENLEINIDGLNNHIRVEIDKWFTVAQEGAVVNNQLSELGNKSAIEQQKKEIDTKITDLKTKNKLSEDELNTFQQIKSKIASLVSRNKEIDNNVKNLLQVSSAQNYFNSSKITFIPAINALPTDLQEKINTGVGKFQNDALEFGNSEVLNYKNVLVAEKVKNEKDVVDTVSKHKVLMEKYKKNEELEGLVNTLGKYTEKIKKIVELEKIKVQKQTDLINCENEIDLTIKRRIQLIKVLLDRINQLKPESQTGIKFGMEFGIEEENLTNLSQSINAREVTDFVLRKEGLKLEKIREECSKFIRNVNSGKQKINTGYDKKEVIKKAFTLTESIFFTAEMEGDKIGGFSRPTMTPGKRALFALRLVLAESEDTWPLLIDQPEDDLDSRSIYDDIVPFLKDKKKERQIIMVSHNANLVISSDSEQIIITNRHGDDRVNIDGKQFNYLTGSLEFSQPLDSKCKDTLLAQGVCEHACSILDGGKVAFENRRNKYQL